MGRKSLDVLIAWLDAARRRDRVAMLALLAPDASWEGIRPEWRCVTPEAVVDHWLERAGALEDLEDVQITPGDNAAVLRLRAPSLAQLDPRLRRGVHIAFALAEDGRIAGLTDTDRRPGAPPAAVAESPGRGDDGWFVVNAADATWMTGAFGAYTRFHEGVPFDRIGVNLGVLEPGQPACWYHREDEQEDFLLLRGEALLLVEGEERRLRQWDFVHCPPWTAHVFVGAGTGPATLLALGGRSGGGVVFPVSELALRHAAGVREETTQSPEAYAGIPPDVPAAFDRAWLPLAD